jgi:hypothetical protein
MYVGVGVVEVAGEAAKGKGGQSRPNVVGRTSLQVHSLVVRHEQVSCCNVFGLWCGLLAAGLDEICGQLPIIKASSKLFTALGFCRPGPTGHAIASKNTIAARGSGRLWPDLGTILAGLRRLQFILIFRQAGAR